MKRHRSASGRIPAPAVATTRPRLRRLGRVTFYPVIPAPAPAGMTKMGLLDIGQSNLTTPIERVDILPRHSGASRNLMLAPPFSSASATGFAPEIGAETAPSSCGIPPAEICPHGLASITGCSTQTQAAGPRATPTRQRHRRASTHPPAPDVVAARSRLRRLACVAGCSAPSATARSPALRRCSAAASDARPTEYSALPKLPRLRSVSG